jgi:two-component system, cell cycle response regulator DivK
MNNLASAVDTQEAHILIVEDNLSNFSLMARLLAFQGMTHCEWKTCGSQVVEFAATQARLDLILMDIYLPGEDGYQVLGKLRAQPQFADTLIVAVTAEATPDNLQRARQAGFDGFIGKPISSTRFPEQICKILHGKAVWEQ